MVDILCIYIICLCLLFIYKYMYFWIYNPGFKKFLDISDVKMISMCVRGGNLILGRCHGSFIHGLWLVL